MNNIFVRALWKVNSLQSSYERHTCIHYSTPLNTKGRETLQFLERMWIVYEFKSQTTSNASAFRRTSAIQTNSEFIFHIKLWTSYATVNGVRRDREHVARNVAGHYHSSRRPKRVDADFLFSFTFHFTVSYLRQSFSHETNSISGTTFRTQMNEEGW